MQTKTILRRLKVRNIKKEKFCNRLHEKAVDFPIDDYEFYLDKIAVENLKIM